MYERPIVDDLINVKVRELNVETNEDGILKWIPS